ncbi:MAG TPA: NAD(P)-binding protein, partial [Isosphaeraceae bacterium]|nr:NAD(P)-binding protein [Isosphaeraceae bacterium]
MGRADDCYDLVVVGGGMGGLAAAVLAQRQGLTTALLEAHTKLGGCAGYFERGPYTFDAGATALMGLNPGEPVGDLLASIGLDFEAQRTAGYRVYMPDGTLDITPDSRAFEDQVCAHFPGREANTRRFWRLQEWVGQRLFRAASNLPKLPVRSTSDVLQTLGTLGLAGSAATATSLLTVGNVLNLLGLSADRRHRAFVAMLLQDTAQAGPETVPFANAAVCLQAYRMG